MSIVVAIIAFVIGFMVGALVYRNNAKRIKTELETLQAKFKEIKDRV